MNNKMNIQVNNSLEKNNGDLLRMGIVSLVYFLIIAFTPSQKFILSLLPFKFESIFALNACLYAFPLLIALLFFGKETLSSFSYFKEKPIKKLILVILGFILIVGGNFIVNVLLSTPGEAENQAVLDKAAGQAPLFLTILLFAIAGPYLEEVIFRHILIGKLSNYINKYLAIGISFIAFVMIHVHAPKDIILYFPVALVLTASYVLSKKHLAFSLLVHILNNTLVVVLPML